MVKHAARSLLVVRKGGVTLLWGNIGRIVLLLSTEDSLSWTKAGVRDLKHLSQKIKMHSICDVHLHSAVKCKMFGSTTNIMSQLNDAHNKSTVRRNEKIARNRHFLNRVVDALKFLWIHELPLRENDESEMSSNRSAFLDLLEYTANMDGTSRDRFSNASEYFKGHSK